MVPILFQNGNFTPRFLCETIVAMKNARQDWKERLQFAYSTNPDFKPQQDEDEIETPEPAKQKLIVGIERKNRGGKCVTLVKGFVGSSDDLTDLGKKLKTKCGVGGAVKEGVIIIQGEHKQKVALLLRDWGYRVTISGK